MSTTAERLEAAGSRRRRGLVAVERATDEIARLIPEARAEGMSLRAIADLTGLTFGRVGHYARFEGGDWRSGARLNLKE